jgi:hypothetical protein
MMAIQRAPSFSLHSTASWFVFGPPFAEKTVSVCPLRNGVGPVSCESASTRAASWPGSPDLRSAAVFSRA